jgi:hypothetical protein
MSEGAGSWPREPVHLRPAPATVLALARLRALRKAQTRRCSLPAVSYCIHRSLERLTS